MMFNLLLISPFLVLEVLCNNPLPSNFYQPISGVYFERWTSRTYYDMSSFNRIPNYPDCPKFVSHSNTFSYSDAYSENQYGRFRASFVSTQTGVHKFFAILNNKAQIYIELNPTGMKKILDASSRTSDDWNHRKWCSDVSLVKGFRYEITVYHYGNGYAPDFFRLGVKFPDNSEVKPITDTYLRRSMEYYKWNGLLAHKYNNFQFPGSQADYTLAKAYSMNPSYPSNPASYLCKSTLYDPPGHQFESYALRYIGYMSVPETGIYKLKMLCNELCQINMTKSGTETILGSYNDAFSIPPIEMNAGTLSSNSWYPITVFFCESYGNDFIQISHKKDSSYYSTSWTDRLLNLLPAETAKSLPLPNSTMLNSTAISVTLPSTPHLPPKDNWIYVQTSEILYHRSGVVETPFKLTVSGALPHTVIASGLEKYTDYVFYARYYGKINGGDQNFITGYSTVVKTDEDVPESAPPNFVVDARSSTSIRCRWGTFSSLSLWNGIGLGYEVQYRLKNVGSGNWTSVLRSGTSNRQYIPTNLLKYRIYEFKVAGRTIKGSGTFSETKEERTMEDVPSAGPSSIIAMKNSSSRIVVAWGDVPAEHQNGIITGYRVYIKKNESSEMWSQEDTNSKQWSKSGLDFWTFYDIKISAKTSVGEGVQSAVVSVRTDEDVPGAPPTNISAFPLSANIINIAWSDIVAEKHYGIILSYKVKYERTDGEGVENEVVTTEKFSKLEGLAANVEYEISVAGMTTKGVGVFSSKVTVTTLEDAPSAPPVNLTGNYTNATAVRLHWNFVPKENRNGIILRYVIQYKIKENNDSHLEWKEIIVGANPLTSHVTELEYYTIYQFRIAAESEIGRGPFSSLVYVRTDAYAPSHSPMNLTGHFLDQQSINITWARVPKEHRQGIIEGYRLYYADKTLPNISWHNLSTPNRHGGGDMFNQTVKGLKIYTPYLFKIAAFTYRAEGAVSESVTVWTDEYAPDESPRNVSGVNASSTEIILKWLAMEEIDGEANGQVLGYTVEYRVADCHEDRPEGCDENEVFNITTYGRSPEIKIPNLRKYTVYNLSVQVFNSKGRGNFSTQIDVRTDEDLPDEPPTTIETWPSQPDSINVYWSPIPESHRNGIILGYRVFYKPIDEPQRRYDRAPRSLNQFAIYGGLPGEKMVEVNSSANSVEIKDLKDYSWYEVRVGAFTSKGFGVTFTINGTTTQRSPTKAPDLEVISMYGFEEIPLRWKPISHTEARGEVLGYRIHYWLSELHDFPALQSKDQIINILEPRRDTVITGLQAFARYLIRIQAYTEGGFGVWSHKYIGDTCRCPKSLSSAKIILPPLVTHKSLEILPALLDQAITSCCGNCSSTHGITKVNWEKDSRNSSSVKYSRQEALDAIVAGTNLALPIFRDSLEIEGDVDSSEYIMVPLIDSRQLAIFKRNPTKKELGNAAATIIRRSLWEQYPIFVISTVMTLLAAILFWLFERGANTAEFSDRYIRGNGSGLWLAYITMTTVGYGDITPVTRLGKIHAVAWMLIGVCLTSMVTGALSSIFSMEFVFEPTPLDSEGKVLTSVETLMITSQIYGRKVKLGNTSDGKHVQQSLLSGNISRVALDIYAAGSLKEYLIHPNILLEKVENIKGSYGVALGRDAKQIRKCIRAFAKESSKSLIEEIEQKMFVYQIGDARTKDLLQHMISPYSDIMENLTQYGGIALVVLFVLGAIHEAIRRCRERNKVETDLCTREKQSDEILQAISDFEASIASKLEEIEKSHEKERSILGKLQHARYAKLVAMYPSLHVFDPEMPKVKREEDEICNTYAMDGVEHQYDYSSDEDDEDGSIDFRMERF